MRKPDIGRKEAGISLITSAAVILLYMASGITFIEAQGTCHTQKISCHGLPLENQCIGVKTSTTDFQSSGECSELENIKQRCTNARQTLCNSTEYSGEEWKETPVQGFSCGEWEQNYPESINFRSC